MKFNLVYFLFLLFPIIHLLFYQIYTLKIENEKSCLNIFKSNNFFGLNNFRKFIHWKVNSLMNKIDILKRLYRSYTKNFRYKILLSLFFSLIVAGSTSSIAWLLDPAINKIFIEKDQTLLMVIPALIIIVFASKGLSLYLARTTMMSVAEDIKAIMQQDMSRSLISADTDYIDDKHTGKFISNLTYDVSLITSLVSTTILNLFKDSLTLIGLLSVMFYQNWKLSLIAIIMIPLATFAAKNLGKRIGKVSTEAQLESGFFNTHLIEIFKNHQLIKIFQQEEI